MALKNIMRVDNGNIIGSVDESYAESFINNNLITDVNGTDVEFKFIYDSTQDKFGYRDASGTFVPFESGGDFSQLIYENLAAANIKSGTTISVKDPDGNVLNSATGSYTVNTFTNLTAANIKNGTTVTIKDSAGTTLKSVTGTYNPKPNIVIPYAATSGGDYVDPSGRYNYGTLDLRISCAGYKTITLGKIYVSAETTYGCYCYIYRDSTLVKSYNYGTYSNQSVNISGVSSYVRIVINAKYYSSAGSGYVQNVTISA